MSTDPHAPVDLELVEDDFTEAQHKRLDMDLISEFDLGAEPLHSDDVYTLIRCIMLQLGDRASEVYKRRGNLQRLIQEKPVLLDILKKGAQQGFQLVRRLKILRRESVILHREITSLPIEVTRQAAQRAWASEYQGIYAEVFRKNIDALPRSRDHANCIPIIQSSGYGKSRMVDELAKLVFTIPLNIRKLAEESTEGAYPPSDPDVWRYLCTTTIRGVNDAEKLVALFLSNLFQHVADEVRNAFPVKKRVPQDIFAKQWREHLFKQIASSDAFSTNRSRLYEQVVVKSGEAFEDTLNREELFTRLRENLTNLLQVLAEHCDYPSPGKRRMRGIQIILYFDEAHELARPIQVGGEKKLYDAVWSILSEFYQPLIFTVFLSTQSSMPLLAPSPEKARSSRQQNTKALWGPVTETPFDCHPMFPLRLGQYGLAHVSQLAFMIRFGRPLFWAMFERKERVEKGVLLSGMMRLARKKLLCEENISAPPRFYSREARIAIIDVLVTIDYEPRRGSAHNFEMELVASHMRTAFSIPYHRTYVRSGYPSEPFLAEAASRQMHHFTKANTSFRVVDDLVDILGDGLIDLGQKGEVVMRLLLRKAYMNAVIQEQPEGIPNFSRGCSFVRFLEALLADPYDTVVKELQPNNIPKNDPRSKQYLAAVFEHAVVRFTHFVKAADEAAMTTKGMVMGFLRGAAIIGWNCQKRVDIAIPILMNRNDMIKEASMSALLIQVKRRHRRGTLNAYLIDATKLDFFPKGDTGDPRPYVTLVAELGAKAPRTWNGIKVKFDRPPARGSSRTEPPRPRYSIRAYECTHHTWKVVMEKEERSYSRILGLDDLLGDHPRQDRASKDIVYRMLPSWYAKPAWLSDKIGTTVEPVLEEAEEVEEVEQVEMEEEAEDEDKEDEDEEEEGDEEEGEEDEEDEEIVDEEMVEVEESGLSALTSLSREKMETD